MSRLKSRAKAAAGSSNHGISVFAQFAGEDASATVASTLTKEVLLDLSEASNGAIVATGTSTQKCVPTEYLLDQVFPPLTPQNQIFAKTTKPALNSALSGKSGNFFVYGPTSQSKSEVLWGDVDGKQGLVAQSFDYIFSALEKAGDKEAEVTAYIFDITKESIRDIGVLHSGKKGEPMVFPELLPCDDEHISDPPGPLLELTPIPVKGMTQVEKIFEVLHQRPPALKGVNYDGASQEATSKFSRTHTVFSIHITREMNQKKVCSRLQFIELAGSEASMFNDGKRSQPRDVMAAKTAENVRSILRRLATRGEVDDSDFDNSASLLALALQPTFETSCWNIMLLNLSAKNTDINQTMDDLAFGHVITNGFDPTTLDSPISSQDQTKKLMKVVEDLRKQLADKTAMYERKLKVLEPHPDAQKEPKEDMAKTVRAPGPQATETSAHSQSDSLSARLRDSTREMEGLQSKIVDLRRKLKKRDNQLKEMEKVQQQKTEAFAKEMSAYRLTIRAYKEQIAEGIQSMTNAREQHNLQRQAVMESAQAAQEALIAELEKRSRSLEETFRTSDGTKAWATFQQKQADEQVAERKKMVAKHQQELSNLKSQYEHYLAEKQSQLKNFVDEYKGYKEDMTTQVKGYQDEVTYLYDLVSNFSMILEKMDQGRYPVYEKHGIQRFNVTDTDRALVQVDADRCKRLKEWIRRAEKANTRISNTLKTKGRDRKEDNEDVDSMDVAQLHEEVRRLRAQLENKPDGKALEQELLDELSGHEVVKYIKQVEDERDFYKSQLREETRRRSGLKVAYESQGRVLRATSASLRATSAQSHGTYSRIGLNSAATTRSGTPNSASSMRSTRSRPYTAASGKGLFAMN